MPNQPKPPPIEIHDNSRNIRVRPVAGREDVWQLQPDQTLQVDWRTPVVGWRYAQVGERHGKLAISPMFPPLGRSPDAACTWPGNHTAETPVPDPACGCGFRIVRDLTALAAYHRFVIDTARELRHEGPPKVFVRVAGAGLCAERQRDDYSTGERFELDPQQCVRIACIEIVGPVLLPPEMQHLTGPLVASYPRLRKQVHVVTDLCALTGGAPPQAVQDVA